MTTPSTVLITQLRRKINEPDDSTYTQAMLVEVLNRYQLYDVNGYAPDNLAWEGAWDLNQAAADIWEEKAAVVVTNYDYAADGANYSRSQVQAQMLAIAARFRSLRKSRAFVMKATPKPWPERPLRSWIGNLAEVLEDYD